MQAADNRIDRLGHALATKLTETFRRHPRRVTGAVAAGLAGFAVTAFGVAPLALDGAEVPQAIVVEAVQPAGLDTVLDALADHEFELDRSTVTRTGDTIDAVLARLGVRDVAAAAALRQLPEARALWAGRAGKMVQARATASGRLVQVVVREAAADDAALPTHFVRTTLRRSGDGWQAESVPAPLEAQVRLGSGTIVSSLFAATDASGIPDAVAVQVAEMFAADIDFRRELRRGDTFSIVYEALTADGEPVAWGASHGRVLAAEFTNGGQTHAAVWFDAGPAGKGAYFGFDGQSKRRAFLASPMEFSRVTSGFAMRFHPILQQWRRHLGVDYAAPTGTPVRTVGDGTVEFAGWQNGYGNTVIVRHSNDRTTLYAHLSRTDVRVGQRIEQGQRVGLVGATGWATGPHLHFEFRVNGEHQDPLRMAKASEALTIAATDRPRFQQVASAARVKLDAAESIAGSMDEHRD